MPNPLPGDFWPRTIGDESGQNAITIERNADTAMGALDDQRILVVTRIRGKIETVLALEPSQAHALADALLAALIGDAGRAAIPDSPGGDTKARPCQEDNK